MALKALVLILVLVEVALGAVFVMDLIEAVGCYVLILVLVEVALGVNKGIE